MFTNLLSRNSAPRFTAPFRTNPRRNNSRRAPVLHSLEPRTLFSVAWNTSDTYQLPAGGSSNVAIGVITSNPQGDLFAAGRATDSAGTIHVIVREQVAGAGTWTTIFDTTAVKEVTGITFDTQGRLFLSAYSTTASSSTGVIFMRDPSGNFTPIDQSLNTVYTGITADSSGNVLASARTYVITQNKNGSSSTAQFWTVRKWSPLTNQFTTVDSFKPSSGNPEVHSIAAFGNTIYAVGQATLVAGSPANWVVRRSTDDGASWATVDSFVYDSSAGASLIGSLAFAITADNAGHISVVGQGISSVITGYKGKTPQYAKGADHWLVRQSASGNPGTWTTIDDYTPTAGVAWDVSSLNLNAIAVDSAGHAYVAGNYNAGSGAATHYAIRTNATGSWTNLEDSTTFATGALLIDPTNTLYAGGASKDPATSTYTWLVRSTSLSAPLTAQAASSFASVSKLSPPVTHKHVEKHHH